MNIDDIDFSNDTQIPASVEKIMMQAEFAADIAYSKRTLYEAYLSEGFDHEQALELCKN